MLLIKLQHIRINNGKERKEPTETDRTAPVPAEARDLSLSDINACVSIIDIVTKRGAFEGPEIADVGAVRNRLAAFLKAATQLKTS